MRKKREENFTYVVIGTIIVILLGWLSLFHLLISRPFDKMLWEFP